MQGHGEDDKIIKLEWARRAAEVLGPRCESLEFKTYKDVGHTVSDLQVNTVIGDAGNRQQPGYNYYHINLRGVAQLAHCFGNKWQCEIKNLWVTGNDLKS